MDRNIGAPNRRLPPDVQPKGSTARDLERPKDERDDRQAPPQPDVSDASATDHD